jgi:dolichyl-diphosphooligosaccharide--protein glycosyltransferase
MDNFFHFLRNAKHSFLKHTNLVHVAVLVAASAVGLYFRFYPVTHNQELRDLNTAQLIAYVSITSNVRQEIERMFPTASPSEKAELEKKKIQEVLTVQKPQIDKLIKFIALQRQEASSKKMYLLEADSYYYLGLTRNLLRYGNLGGERKGVLYFNPRMMAPLGFWYNFDLHPYVGMWMYRMAHFFNKAVALESVVAVVPLVLFLVAISIFFWLIQVMGWGVSARSLGLLYFASFPILIFRNSFGWYDTDIYNVIFPLLVVISVWKALSCEANRFRRVGWMAAGAFFSALYALFWRGWIYLPLFVCVTFFIIGLCALLMRPLRKEAQTVLLLGFSYVMGIVAFSFLLIGMAGLEQAFLQSITVAQSFLHLKESVWPDVYITIGELRKLEYRSVLDSLGGWFPIVVGFLGVGGMGYSLVQKVRKHSTPLPTTFLLIFSIFLLCFSLSAERFLLFTMVPMVIFFCVGVQICVSQGARWSQSGFSWRRFVFSVRWLRPLCIGGGVVGLVFMGTVLRAAHREASQQFPIMNDAWMQVLTQIRERTPADSIVNTWWCPGHFITSISQRRVTFDGATQDTPQGYWMANVFLSGDEKYSLGILRMLNTSGNESFNFLTGWGILLRRLLLSFGA